MTDDNKLLASMTGFTPGPWAWGEYNNGLYGNGDVVLTYDDYDGMSCGMDENAALIAAAPDLLRIALERGAEIARLHKALDNIGELNLLPRDENGHKWWNSDLIAQEVMVARAPSKAKP